MAAQPVQSFKGSVILTEFAAGQRAKREAAARRDLAAQQSRSFAAAQLNRLTSSWRVTADRIDDEIRADLDALRQRSRSLENNNDYARNYLDIVETNMIGDVAPRLVSQADNAPGNPDTGAREAIVNAWNDWSKVGNCEVSGQYSFTALCQSIVRATARDGECLVALHPGADNAYGFALQMIDVDRLATWLNRDAGEGQNAISGGVEVNAVGKPVGYHLTTGNGKSKSATRFDAKTLLHRFVVQRPEQKRGIPWMHASMLSMHYAGEFALSALMAAKHGADHLGFFVTPDGAPPNLGDDATDELGAKIMTSAPGTYDTLPAGVDIRTIDSRYPNEVFGPFVKSAHQRMASGLPGASYPELCNDYEAVNFSSIRTAVLSTRDEWKKRHKWFADAWLDPIFAEWLRYALAKGAIKLANGSPLPVSKAEKFAAHTWQFRGWSWVDPLKDIQTAKEAIDLRVTSRTRVAREMGRDIEEIFDELQAEEALAGKYGVALKAEQPAMPAPPAPEDDGTKALMMAMASRAMESKAGDTVVNVAQPSITLNQGEIRHDITLPEQAAPVVNITNAIAERELPAPVIHFAPVNNVAAPEVTVEVDAIMPAETEMRIVSLPDRVTTTQIERDANGAITNSKQVETDR
ncbi:MAG: phage portal protein [Azonexus sp.]|nr:phage portal protein [Azonexus sp.]